MSALHRRDRGSAGPLLLVLVLFAVLAAFVYVNNQNPEIRRINLVAQQYADAWRTGSLDGVDYDELSGPDVGKGDAGKINDNVRWIVNGLDGAVDDNADLRPDKVEVDRGTTQRNGPEATLATVKLWVTWRLLPQGLDQAAHYWTYPVTLTERLVGGRWRVVWTPQTVHPAIRHGLVLTVSRSFAARGTLLGAGDTPLPPASQPALAKELLGSISTVATHEQAELEPLRAKPGDTVGVAGLQNLYDTRLAGGAGIQVKATLVKGYSGVTAPADPLYVGAPQTPAPIKLTLDRRTQVWAEGALAGATQPATLVVVRPSTGDLLAVANTGGGGAKGPEYGLSSQTPPGPAFGLVSALALLRSPARSQQTAEIYKLSTRVDCSQPYSLGGQVFRNTQGPNLAGVQLGAALEGGCTTALARVSADVPATTLQSAAYDLGVATPRSATGGAPGLLTVADQLGVPAFHGTVPPTPEEPATDAVSHAENLIGEGSVLVSPLSMARGAATVASGTRRSVRLVVDPVARAVDQPKDLQPAELEALRVVMSKGVTEQGGSAHALAALGDVHALAGTGGYGTGQGQKRQAWCIGYLGDYAFAVLVPNVATGTTAAPAVQIASKFLDATR